MKLRIPLALAAVTVTGLIVGIAAPVSAANTDTTFTLTGGDLTLAVQPAASLTTEAASGDTLISGSLGLVTVTDERGVAEAWIVSAGSSAFTAAGGSASTAVHYTGGVVSTTGTITVADGAETTLDEAEVSVVAPTTLSGNNTASWTPVLDVTMPAGALADSYSGMVTTSIA